LKNKDSRRQPSKDAAKPSMTDKTRFELNLEHARASYSNAQETVRFVDGKSGILTGIITITTGLPFGSLQLVLFSQSERADKILQWFAGCGTISTTLMGAPIIVGIFFGTMSLLSSTNGLMARRPRTPDQREGGLPRELCRFLAEKVAAVFGKIPDVRNPPPLTCLFPYFTPEQSGRAVQNFQRLGRGDYSQEEILHEYGLQLESIGNILHTKSTRNRDAVRWFELQLVSYTMAMLLASLVLIYGGLHGPAEQKAKPAEAVLVLTSTSALPTPPPGKIALTPPPSTSGPNSPAIRPSSSASP
jgi:hypothetical protein